MSDTPKVRRIPANRKDPHLIKTGIYARVSTARVEQLIWKPSPGRKEYTVESMHCRVLYFVLTVGMFFSGHAGTCMAGIGLCGAALHGCIKRTEISTARPGP